MVNRDDLIMELDEYNWDLEELVGALLTAKEKLEVAEEKAEKLQEIIDSYDNE